MLTKSPDDRILKYWFKVFLITENNRKTMQDEMEPIEQCGCKDDQCVPKTNDKMPCLNSTNEIKKCMHNLLVYVDCKHKICHHCIQSKKGRRLPKKST